MGPYGNYQIQPLPVDYGLAILWFSGTLLVLIVVILTLALLFRNHVVRSTWLIMLTLAELIVASLALDAFKAAIKVADQLGRFDGMAFIEYLCLDIIEVVALMTPVCILAMVVISSTRKRQYESV